MSWESICAEIEAEPKLTPAEEQILHRAHEAGDEWAKRKLIACSLRYALGTARSLAKQSGRWEPGDLLGEAVAAMSSAFDRWNGTGSFAGYVQPRVRGAMQDFLRRKADVVRGPAGAERALSLDAPGEDDRTPLDLLKSDDPEEEAFEMGFTALEARVMEATILASPPASAREAARRLKLTEATVSRVLRGALRKRAATGIS